MFRIFLWFIGIIGAIMSGVVTKGNVMDLLMSDESPGGVARALAFSLMMLSDRFFPPSILKFLTANLQVQVYGIN